jgi:hypothetical protein
MIRLLVNLGKWLDRRFPEKVVVKAEEWEAVKTCLESLNARLDPLEKDVEAMLKRLSVVETSAVHKGAVQDLVSAVKVVTDDFTSLKVSLGMNRIANSDIQAMLNGEYISPSEESNA